ncbi:MAG: orotate phosphoribosyltransferase [Actinomycetaceae bacterium]|nr:orotate phosphoribosyltransferase [Actinomycetaceae bacterium]
MTHDSHKARLSELVTELALIHEKVTLASGRESDFYVDMRRATLHHEAAPLIGHVMLDLLEEAGFAVGEEYQAVGGLTMGADPVATSMLHAAASRGLDLDAFVVRKAAKDHGMKRRIEGPDIAGRKVVILEDTSTTGGSPLEAAHAAVEAGATVVAVAVIVDRATGAKERIEAEGFPYFAALGLKDLHLA